MKILFDIGHAAHVHLFREMIRQLTLQGHQITVVSRDKPHVIALLDSYQISHQCLSRPGKGFVRLFLEWLQRTWKILCLHKAQQFDLAIGTSVSISYLSLFHRVISINVQEDDDAVVPLHVLLAYPFSSFIVNPAMLKFELFRKKRLLHQSLHEMAYLSTQVFTPSLQIIEKYRLQPFQYLVIRKVKLDAHHDAGQSGLSKEHLATVNNAAAGLKVVQSNETGAQSIAVADMHHILAFARLLVTDSQTMAAEAACIGTPVIQVSSFNDRLSYIRELKQLGFIHGFTPSQNVEFHDALVHYLAPTFSATIETKRRIDNRSQIHQRYPDFTSEFFRLLRENNIADFS